MTRVLLTSVCRPIGPSVGDAPSVGYELLHGQVTRAQGLFSPRSHHLHFSLEYIAENLDVPCVVLQYPSRRELIRELRKGCDYVCVSFLLAVFHRMKEVVALVREHAPHAKIVLGGYGTVLPDEVLAPWGDVICREEGVAFMRELLGEPPIAMPYSHPLIVSRLKIFGRPVSRTGMVFAGLGCPNGCDFCCTSHFFKRRHIKLLPTGADIHRVVERYLDLDPDISIVVLDEDFLLNRRRAMQFRDAVLQSGRALSIFAFASIRALSQYKTEEIVEMGIDGLWIGYEGTRSGYAKQSGRSPDELFPELRKHGISILASMIVGLPYQNESIVQEELDGLLRLKPDLCQFLIYGPTPGTPFYDQTVKDGLLREEFVTDPERYYKACDGFTSMTVHPTLTPQTIETLQRDCFDQDFHVLGPTIYRSISTWLAGYRTLRASDNPALQRKAERFARDIRNAYPVFLAGRLLGPNKVVRQGIGQLQKAVHAELGGPSWTERLSSIAAVGLAMWTSIGLRLGWSRHPNLVRHTYRVPVGARRPSRVWRRVAKQGHPVMLELRPERTVWVRLGGALAREDAALLAKRMRSALERTRNQLVIDLESITQFEHDAATALASALREHRDRIRILAPATMNHPGVRAALAIFALYQGAGLVGGDLLPG